MAEIILFSDVNGALGVSRYAGPYRLATELRMNGFEVQVIEFFASIGVDTIKKIIQVHVDKNTLFVGFSATLWTKYLTDQEMEDTYTSNKKSIRSIIVDSMVSLFPYNDDEMKEIINEIHRNNSKTKIVVGGYKAANSYNTSNINFWILGQGEVATVKLARHLKFDEDLKCISTDWGNILTDKMYPYDSFSTSTIKWHSSDFLFKGENVPIETARGCIFKCSFCAFNLNGKKFGDYTKCKDTLQKELIHNYETYGISEYMISDDTLNDSMKKVEFLYNVITSLPFKINFSAYGRLDVLGANPDMAPMLKEIGLRSVEFGVETMNKKTGKFIGKLGDRDKIIKYLEDLKTQWKDDVYIAAGFIIGLPHEDENSIRETMNWLYQKDNPLSGIQMNRYWYHIPPALNGTHMEASKLKDAGFQLTPSGWVYENISKIFSDPSAYGYDSTSMPTSQSWKNTYLTTEIAENLEQEFYQDSRARQKNSMSIFQYYNRMRNLGYDHRQIKNLYTDDLVFVKSAIIKKNRIKNNYLGNIL